MTTREWSGLILEDRTEYGSAARANRGRHAGHKVHRLACEYVVGVVPGSEHRPGSYGAMFLRSGKPILFNASPACGCTSGQHAGRPCPGLTPEKVTCEKCAGR
jgi:hypothetical protein